MEIEPIAALDLRTYSLELSESIGSKWYNEKDYIITRYDELEDGYFVATILTRNVSLINNLLDEEVPGVSVVLEPRSVAPADIFDLLFVPDKSEDLLWVPTRLSKLLSI